MTPRIHAEEKQAAHMGEAAQATKGEGLLKRTMTILTITSLLALCYLTRGADARTRSVETRIDWLQKRVAHHQGFVRFIASHHLLERNGCGQNVTVDAPNRRVCRRLERIYQFEAAALKWTRRELREARRELWRRDYAWWLWLPAKWQRIGACETGYGKRPGNFHHDSGTYVSAFGIIRAGYAQYAHEIGLPGWDAPGERTPREQFRVAMQIYKHYGLSGWGCRNA